jgi:ketosteroid isomerase-like protein
LSEPAQSVRSAAETIQRFFDAFNARDLDALRELVTEDTVFRSPQGGRALTGDRGARALLLAAEEAKLTLVRDGEEELADDGRMAVPVRVVIRIGHDMHGTALFEINDGKITAFEVVSELADR